MGGETCEGNVNSHTPEFGIQSFCIINLSNLKYYILLKIRKKYFISEIIEEFLNSVSVELWNRLPNKVKQ